MDIKSLPAFHLETGDRYLVPCCETPQRRDLRCLHANRTMGSPAPRPASTTPWAPRRRQDGQFHLPRLHRPTWLASLYRSESCSCATSQAPRTASCQWLRRSQWGAGGPQINESIMQDEPNW